jgi:hypothetical protein
MEITSTAVAGAIWDARRVGDRLNHDAVRGDLDRGRKRRQVLADAHASG